MEINNSNPKINFGNRKIPRYLYHFTNKKAYKQMLNDGFTKMSDNDPYLKDKGIFAVDWTNFCKLWGHNKSWGESGTTLQEYLLRTAAKWINSVKEGANELVVLRIKTDKLKRNKLTVRSQKLFFDVKENDIKINTLSTKQKEHILGDKSAIEGKKLKRKEAVEYIYKESIPIEDIEEIGFPINIAELRKTEEFDYNAPVKSVLTKALVGTNEEKGIQFIN